MKNPVAYIKNSIVDFIDSFRKPEGKKTYRQIGKVAFPAFLELFLISLKGIVDMLMVSSLGIQAISGVGLTNQPFFLMIAIFNAVNVGTTTLVSWNIGKGDLARAAKITKQAIIFNFGIGAVIAAIGFFGAGPLMNLIGVDDPVVLAYATQYMEIIAISVAFHAVSMAITAALRGAGQTKIPMLYNLCGNALHLSLNFLLINGNLGFPALGVQGAAISATTSRIIISMAALFILAFWKKSPLRIKLNKDWRPRLKIAGDIFAIGMPAAGEQFAIQTGLLVYTSMVASLYTYAFTAHQIAININGLAFAVSMSFGISTTALVGRACGQDDYDLAYRYTIFTRRLARAITAVITASFIIFSANIIGIYTENPIVIDYGVPVFWFMALTQFVQSSNMSTAGALRGSGDTMYPLYASIIGIWGTRLILAAFFIFVMEWGVWGAWLSFFIDQCSRSWVVSRRFNSGKWREMKAVREAKAAARRQKLESRNS